MDHTSTPQRRRMWTLVAVGVLAVVGLANLAWWARSRTVTPDPCPTSGTSQAVAPGCLGIDVEPVAEAPTVVAVAIGRAIGLLGAPGRDVAIEIDAVELAGLTGDTSLVVRWPGGGVELTARRAEVDVSLPAGIDRVEAAYLGPAGESRGPVWDQPVTGDRLVVRQPWRGTRTPAERGIVLAWLIGSDPGAQLADLDRAPGVTVASPVWYTLGDDGTLVGIGVENEKRFVEGAHDRDVAVWPALASFDAELMHEVLGDPDRRRALASDLAARAAAVGADGVNVDLEGYGMPDGGLVAAFVAEVAEEVHVWEGIVSVDVTVLSDSWTMTPAEYEFWSTAPDRRALAAAADYVVLMAYDEHNPLRPSGPVASPAWVEDAVTYLLRFVDADRVLLGIPFYGRVWDGAEPESPRAVGMDALADLAEQGTSRPDSQTGLLRVDLPDGRYLWIEDAEGLNHRVELVARHGLAGVAGWRLGLEAAEVWPILQRVGIR